MPSWDSLGEKVAFGHPILLRVVSEDPYENDEDGFWVADSSGVSGFGKRNNTSLVAFHGPKGTRRQSHDIADHNARNQVFVQSGNRVTIFGNVKGGIYLSPTGRPKLLWKRTKQEVMKEVLQESEFNVRIVKRRIPPPALKRHSPAFATAVSSGSGNIPGSAASSSSTAGRKNESSVGGWCGGNIAGARAQPAAEETKVEEPLLDNTLRYGDEVVFESRFHEGWFVTVNAENSKGEGINILARETAEHITSPHAYTVCAIPMTFAQKVRTSTTHTSTLFGLSLVDRIMAKGNNSRLPFPPEMWVEMLTRLPTEVAIHICSYRKDWMKSFRVVCKEWRMIAEEKVARIRVGEFADTGSRRNREALLNFVLRCTNLRDLKLNVTQLSDAEMTSIGRKEHLTNLAIGGCPRLTDETIKMVCNIKGLRILNLATVSITDGGVDMLSKNLLRLKSLNLYGCRLISDHGFMFLCNLRTLQSVNVRGTPITDEAVERMRSLHVNKNSLTVLTGPYLTDGIY